MPIEGMKHGANRFASGDLDYRLPEAHTDEMAGLADAMNRMAQQLRKRLIHITQQHNEIEAILASMREGLIALDSGERVIKINQAAQEILGVSWGPDKNMDILELVRNRDLEQLIHQLLSTEVPAEKDILFHRNGERVIHVHGSPIHGVGKSRVGTLLMLNDVTQLRRLENIRQDFAANVSHELKTPLTAVKGFVETLLHGSLDDAEENRRFLSIIERHVLRLEAIIEDLMTLARIEVEGESGRIGMQSHPIDEILKRAVELRRPEGEEKRIQIELACNDAPRMKMDAILFEQAAANLLDNAIKYSPEGSVVRIESRLDTAGLTVSFKDAGIGIEKRHIPRLFERFYRVDLARSRKLGGTGLGLAIVKHIVQAHGGRITVESLPGKGSTFMLHFPHSTLDPPATGAEPTGSSAK
jgi:two-component system phosphate regulon sensor histidine kinase PhoR